MIRLHTERRFDTFKVVDAHTGVVSDTFDNRADAGTAKSALNNKGEWAWRVRGETARN